MYNIYISGTIQPNSDLSCIQKKKIFQDVYQKIAVKPGFIFLVEFIQLTISILHGKSPHTEIFQSAQGRNLVASQTFEMECSLAFLLIPHKTKSWQNSSLLNKNVDKTMIKHD